MYDRNHLFGLGSDTETKTANWPKLLADTETNRNHNILNWKALHLGVCKKFSCHVNYDYQNISHFFWDFKYLYHLESLNAVLYLSGHNLNDFFVDS